jgi:TatD DNase family protein
LPVIVHNRDASADVVRLLRDAEVPSDRRHPGGIAGRDTGDPVRGVLHSFSADWETAEAALALGFYLGFTGPLTYKKADDLRAIAACAPLDRILIETDAPFLAPQPHRGKRNEPAYVRHVAERLAELRGLSLVEVAAATTANALSLFEIGARD